MKTHESILLANFPTVTQKVETGARHHARKFLLEGRELMERRLTVHIDRDRATLEVQYNALGSFQETEKITITREQLEFLQKIWL